MSAPRSLRLSVVALSLVVWLAGCPAVTPSTPTPPAATATPLPPTATPLPPTPKSWTEHSTAALSISLPASWQVLDVPPDSTEQTFAEFQKSNPDLAGIIGSAQALQDVALWAFNGQASGYVDNLNIRRSPLTDPKPENVQQVLDTVVGKYQQLNFTNIESQVGLTIGGHPAGVVSYNFEVTDTSGNTVSVQGWQYLVLTDADLWVLSYTLSPDQSAALKPVVEQSAQSFQVK